MTNNFRALCAELLDEVVARPLILDRELIARARAALGEADEPVMPEGKNPTRDELWELWLRLNNELPDKPAAVAAFWEHAQINARARAALAKADEPAVPQGREPAAVSGRPSDEELLATLDKATAAFPPRHPEAEGLNASEYLLALELRKARAVLARWGNHVPAPPADGEVTELVETLKGIAYWKRHGKPGEPAPASFDIRQADRLNRAAELLQRLSPPQPVPVGERPWEREG